MPNGAYNPQCDNCDAFKYRRSRWSCQRHKFRMPELSELICKDYTHSQEATPFTAQLDYGNLYYYSYASNAIPQSLGRFEEIQTPIFHAGIRQDAEYGWIIYTHPADPLPNKDKIITLVVKQQSVACRIVDIERTFATGGTQLPDKSWKATYTTSIHQVVVPVNHPHILGEWLNELYDLSAYAAFIENHAMRESIKGFPIYALIKVLKPRSVYEVLPDMIQHIASFGKNI